MDSFLRTFLWIIVGAVVILVVPVGVAIGLTWEPAQTNNLVTGGLTICGGAVAIVALGVGLGVGFNLARDRRDAGRQATPTYQVQQPARSDYDHWRAQRAMIEAQRAAVQLERDRQALLPPPQATPVDWPAETDWQWIDATRDERW